MTLGALGKHSQKTIGLYVAKVDTHNQTQLFSSSLPPAALPGAKLLPIL